MGQPGAAGWRISSSYHRFGSPQQSAQFVADPEKISEIFVIDNTPPEIKNLAAQKSGEQWTAGFEALDQLSRIKEAWYAVDAGDWQLIYPVDNVADQRRENYQFTISNLTSATPGILAVKVVDANGNSGFGKVRMR